MRRAAAGGVLGREVLELLLSEVCFCSEPRLLRFIFKGSWPKAGTPKGFLVPEVVTSLGELGWLLAFCLLVVMTRLGELGWLLAFCLLEVVTRLFEELGWLLSFCLLVVVTRLVEELGWPLAFWGTEGAPDGSI